jgi:acetyltransferase-like isoleucine patch superfamily enzyme
MYTLGVAFLNRVGTYVDNTLCKLRGRFWKIFLNSTGDDLRVKHGVGIVNPNNISLGHNVFLNHHVNLDGTSGLIKLGNDISVGFNTSFITANHDISTKKLNKRLIGGTIIIEDNVWIAAHCVILPNVTIKTGSVVAAGAVVTKDVPSYVVGAGVPAKVIKTRKHLREFK